MIIPTLSFRLSEFMLELKSNNKKILLNKKRDRMNGAEISIPTQPLARMFDRSSVRFRCLNCSV